MLHLESRVKLQVNDQHNIQFPQFNVQREGKGEGKDEGKGATFQQKKTKRKGRAPDTNTFANIQVKEKGRVFISGFSCNSYGFFHSMKSDYWLDLLLY